jgi:hypothetical protein
MRSVLALLACVAGGGLSVALADPPAAPASTSEAATPATPATPGNPAAAPVAATSAGGVTTTGATPAGPAAQPASSVTITAEQAAMEKHFLAEGYKVEMRNGQKYYCRREETLGTRLGSQKFCSTEEQLKATEAQAKDLVGTSQRQQASGPSGR